MSDYTRINQQAVNIANLHREAMNLDRLYPRHDDPENDDLNDLPGIYCADDIEQNVW